MTNRIQIGTGALLIILLSCNCAKEYHENGVISIKYCKNSSGEIHGAYEEFHDNGKPFIRTSYSNGKLAGEYEYFHETGLLMYKAIYDMDKLVRVDKYVDEKGNNLFNFDFENGNGTFHCYYFKGGNLKSFGHVVNGYRHGDWYINSNKGIIDTVTYNNGVDSISGKFRLVIP